MDTSLIPFSGPWPGMTPATRTYQLDRQLFELNAHGARVTHRHSLRTVHRVRAAFGKCSPLASIVSQKAYALMKGVVSLWNPDTKKPLADRSRFREWERFLRMPNDHQSHRQFFIEAYTYQQMYGYCVIEPQYPAGFNDRPSSMEVLIPWLIEWGPSLGTRRRPMQAWYGSGPDRRELDVKNLIIIVDPASTDYDESTWLPLSRAACLENEVSNVIAALEARGEMVSDRGGLGILSNVAKDGAGPMPIQPDERVRLDGWVGEYGITKGKKKIMVTNAGLSWQPMTFNVEELGLHPEVIANIKAICNRYGFPFTMLAEGFEAKYNNSGAGRRDFQDTTIDPESMDFFEQLTRGLNRNREAWEAYVDYSGVASVQLSQKEKGEGEQAMATAMTTEYELGIITRNEARERLGMERVAGKDGEFDRFKFETDSAIAAQEQMQQQDDEHEIQSDAS